MTTPADVARAFEGKTQGSVRTDRVTRELYSTDASPYRILPVAVLRPAHVDDLGVAVEVCRELGVSITPRGAGTSFTGQCVGEGLQVDCSLLDGIEWIDAERRIARVQPGARWWELNEQAAKVGLHFGPDPATKRQCTVGGMTATNSGGTHSIVYGATVDHVHAVEVLLADGRTARLDGAGGWPADVASALEGVRTRAAPLLGPAFSTLARRGGGYQLEHLCGDEPHAARLLAGSEGTLALLTAVEVTLDLLPSERVLAVVAFDDLHAAIAAVPGLVDTGPCAVEVVSKSMIDFARGDTFHAAAVSAIDASAGALLFVEYQGFEAKEAGAGFVRMDRVLDGCAGVRSRERYVEPAAQASMWAVREAGIGALSNVAGGPNLPQAFVEDTVVAVDKLPPYIRALDEVFVRHEMNVVWYGHASTGLVHVRPFLDLSNARDLERLNGLMGAVTDLVRDWGGDHSGEHGEGLARTQWNERLYGSALYAELRAIKGAFDPTNVLNPGKVEDGPVPGAVPKTIDNLRYGATYERRAVESQMTFSDYGGFEPFAERCYGAGFCRKRVGVMCPPAAATGLEEHTTRARANLLRAVVAGDLELDDLAEDQAREVMDTCVGCKACKTECPARIDIARAKTWWTDALRRKEGATSLQQAISHLRRLSSLGIAVAPFANGVLGSTMVKRRLGIAAQRSLPTLARRPLTVRLPTSTRGPLLYPDCFTTYQEPEIGEAAARLIPGLSLAVVGCCGRVMLSEGYVAKARRAAQRGARALRHAEGSILFCEPSCMSAVVDDWPHLIGDVSDIAARCRLVEEAVPDTAMFRPGGRVLFHPHCHQRSLWGSGGTEAALRRVPEVEVEVPDSGCCGMAGAFGYRADRYELSVAMGERVLAPAVRATDAEIVATGTSCRHQISDLTGRRALHPVEFLSGRVEQ
ncbi:MAG: FAD-binding and (Fe-S)-binding domain-containing protein [Actinomycetota bacterium]